ncbi:MAG TPA: adenylate kinase [Bryobacteraceae bacterium]|nr:adenylate kinase [Bryobacteraceae bacterium]
MIILLFGAPGSGKGTQARFISESRGIPAISTGDMLRAECRAATVLGKAACAVLANGSLLDDATMNAIVARRLQQPDCSSGFILDGYPRTVPQATSLSQFLENAGLPEPTIVHLDVPDAVLVARLSSRRYCPSCGRTYHLLAQPPARPGQCDGDGEALIQRSDDAAAVVVERLKAYRLLTEPLIQYYQGPHYHRVNGGCEPEEISQRIDAVIMADAAQDDREPVACTKLR